MSIRLLHSQQPVYLFPQRCEFALTLEVNATVRFSLLTLWHISFFKNAATLESKFILYPHNCGRGQRVKYAKETLHCRRCGLDENVKQLQRFSFDDFPMLGENETLLANACGLHRLNLFQQTLFACEFAPQLQTLGQRLVELCSRTADEQPVLQPRRLIHRTRRGLPGAVSV